MSYIVRRIHPDGRLGFTGPIRSEKQAQKEADAWESIGHTAEVEVYGSAQKSEVRAWERAKRTQREE